MLRLLNNFQYFAEFLENPEQNDFKNVQQFKNINIEQSYNNRELEQAFVNLSSDTFNKKTASSLYLSKEVGNIYCGSLYAALLSLISDDPNKLVVFFYFKINS